MNQLSNNSIIKIYPYFKRELVLIKISKTEITFYLEIFLFLLTQEKSTQLSVLQKYFIYTILNDFFCL